MNELKTKSVFILTLLVWSALSFRQRAWGDGAATSAQFFNPEAVAVDSVGNVFVADSHNHTIRKLTPLGTNWVSSTIAGVPGVVGSADGANSAALFYSPFGIAVDSRGDVYVADTGNHTIRKLTATGTNWISTTIAGMAGSADFYCPQGIAVDRAGSVYVADPCGVTIRKLTPPGTNWLTIASGFIADSFIGTNSEGLFSYPQDIAVDAAGQVYVADGGNSAIHKLTPTGTNWVSSTIAGGVLGCADGTNGAARFGNPTGIALDSAGNLYVADAQTPILWGNGNTTIRKLTPVGTNWVSSTIAGSTTGYSDGSNGLARFSEPKGIALDHAGNLYVADSGNHAIRQLTPVGSNWVSTTISGVAGLPGSVDGITSAAQLIDEPYSFGPFAGGGQSGSFHLDGSLCEWISVFGGSIEPGQEDYFSPFGGWAPASSITLDPPDHHGSFCPMLPELFWGSSGVALDNARNAYIADQVSHTIRKVHAGGEFARGWPGGVSILAGFPGVAGTADGIGSEARFNNPSGVAVDNAGNVFVADSMNHQIRKLAFSGTNDWMVTTLAGLAGNPGSTDGVGSAARFAAPRSVAVDSFGNVYVADTLNNTIRKVTPAGVVTTLAGSPGTSGNVDGTGNDARFHSPYGIAVDRAANLYVADTWNHTIRKVTADRTVTTLAGLAGTAGLVDGIGDAARFSFPTGVAADSEGSVFVADTDNNIIRKLTSVGTNWMVITLGVWTGGAMFFDKPRGVALDGVGNLYVADYSEVISRGHSTTSSAIKIFDPGFNAGLFGFSLFPPLDRLLVVEASTNLLSWLPIWTNIFTGNFSYSQQFNDLRSGAYPKRFYRTHLP